MRLMKHLVPLAILLAATLRAQYPPDQQWQTIRTQHFDVVFPHLIEADGQRAANALETVYVPLANSLGASLQRHTVVILANENITRLNIGSVPLFPHMSTFSMMPQQDFSGTNDWITTLTVSEARHLVQIAKMRHGFDPNQPVVRVETMEEVIANSIWGPRFSAWIFSVLSGLSVLLTAVGVYSVVAYTSALRAREVGIRVALGATTNDVMAVILRGAMIPLVIGLGLSTVATLLLSRLLTNLLYGVSSNDPLTYLSAGALLLLIGAAASAHPAWRAATRDPLKTLRAD